jgi:hypothetical protein
MIHHLLPFQDLRHQAGALPHLHQPLVGLAVLQPHNDGMAR